ncbi:MAG: CTP-dependent riboflavin kinase [Deltaproteobacteria bacterium]|nr:CTP-dependent riboflavin kinase [Deltaproteobacteria bacterium]MBW2136158.1 CTP-dependent riboflavin kinase [Deltaproteobacteria bacterium]
MTKRGEGARGKEVVIRGKVVGGVRKASYFTQLDWVQGQCLEKLGFRPYPGTLNLEVDEESLRALEAMKGEDSVVLAPPSKDFCTAQTLPATIGPVEGAILIPEERVMVHGRTTVEIIAPLRLKDALGLREGDTLTVRIGRVDGD